jgi:hypothetical protein
MAPVRMTDHVMAALGRVRYAYRGESKTNVKDACVIGYYRTGEEIAWPLYIVNRDGHLKVAYQAAHGRRLAVEHRV